MEFFAPILTIIVSFFNFILVLRAWLQFCRVDVNMPLSQALLRLTSPLVDPIGKVIPTTVKRINLAALLLAFLFVTVKFAIFDVTLLDAMLIGGLSVLKTFGNILFFASLIRALMSWVTQGNHPLDYIIAQITEPVLGPIRKLLPKTGILDFSIMVLGIGLLLLNNLMFQLFSINWILA